MWAKAHERRADAPGGQKDRAVADAKVTALQLQLPRQNATLPA